MKFSLILLTLGYSLNLWAHAIHHHPPVPYESVHLEHSSQAKLLNVIKEGHPTLRKVAEELSLDEIDSRETQELIDDMAFTMKFFGGVGIAAPQVNVSKRLFLIKSRSRGAVAYINPEMNYLEEFGKKNSREGCLSIPGKAYFVPRYKKVEISYLDRFGEEVFEEAEGFKAIVLQHEYDHLDGKLISDFGLNLDFFSEDTSQVPLF